MKMKVRRKATEGAFFTAHWYDGPVNIGGTFPANSNTKWEYRPAGYSLVYARPYSGFGAGAPVSTGRWVLDNGGVLTHDEFCQWYTPVVEVEPSPEPAKPKVPQPLSDEELGRRFAAAHRIDLCESRVTLGDNAQGIRFHFRDSRVATNLPYRWLTAVTWKVNGREWATQENAFAFLGTYLRELVAVADLVRQIDKPE